MRKLLQPLLGKKREDGAMAILSVVVVAFVVVTTLSTVYIYLVNRAKYHQRIRDAYQLTHVMEEFGKLVRQARDTAQANPACTPTTPIGGGLNICFPPCPAALPAGATCVVSQGYRCVTHLNKAYCLSGDPQFTASAGVVGTYANFDVIEIKAEKENQFAQWYARLDYFFGDVEGLDKSIQVAATEASKIMTQGSERQPGFVDWLTTMQSASAQSGYSCDGTCSRNWCSGAGGETHPSHCQCCDNLCAANSSTECQAYTCGQATTPSTSCTSICTGSYASQYASCQQYRQNTTPTTVTTTTRPVTTMAPTTITTTTKLVTTTIAQTTTTRPEVTRTTVTVTTVTRSTTTIVQTTTTRPITTTTGTIAGQKRTCGMSADDAEAAGRNCHSREGACACLCDAGVVPDANVCGPQATAQAVDCRVNPTDNRCIVCDGTVSGRGCVQLSYQVPPAKPGDPPLVFRQFMKLTN